MKSNKKINSSLFSDQDNERYKSHQKSKYISEDNYKVKNKATNYKKKIYSAPTTINLVFEAQCKV